MVVWENEDTKQFLSPVASFANHMLNGNWSKGEQGLLVRTFDKTLAKVDPDSLLELVKEHDLPESFRNPVPPLKFLPSSYLHASMEAPGAIYSEYVKPEEPLGDFTLLIGTKFANNTSMERFQRNNKAIGCEVIYPADSTSIERGSIFGIEYCSPGRLSEVCVEGECLAEGPAACGKCQVEPSNYGDVLSRWIEMINNETLSYVFRTTCYYHSFRDAIVAANSMWKERARWFTYELAISYQGYTECASDAAEMNNIDMADAIVLTLHRTDNAMPQTHLQHSDHDLVEKRLVHAHQKGYGDLPVIWYRESVGIQSIETCVELFNGRNCDTPWQKEFFSAEFMFGNKNCLYKPPECDEVYYFPADGDECSAFTDKGKERMKKLCQNERKHDARIAYEDILSGKHELYTSPMMLLRSAASDQQDSPHQAATINTDFVTAAPSSWLTNSSFLFLGVMVSVFFGPRKIKIQLSKDDDDREAPKN